MTREEWIPYENLIIGIVKQAKTDLHGQSPYWRRDASKFFKGKWFENLTGLDGKEILEQLRRMRFEEDA